MPKILKPSVINTVKQTQFKLILNKFLNMGKGSLNKLLIIIRSKKCQKEKGLGHKELRIKSKK